jgi:Zn-dependent peptidase ImmA (M78 family)
MTNEVEEAEATHFAMCLLMPEDQVKAAVRAMGGIDIAGDDDMRKLAATFKVSLTLMAMRIAQIKWGVRVR